MNIITEKVNLYIIKGLLLLSLFSPLIVFDNFFFPFIVPKTIFFQIIIELVLFFYILLILRNRSYLPKFDALSKSILAFFFIVFLSALFGENIERSFFGVFERMLGVFNLAHFVVMFFVLRSVVLSEKDWFLFIRMFITSGVLVAVYGVGQKLGLSFLYNAGADRIDSTIGNAAFFAAYMIFIFFFSFYLILKERVGGYIYFYYFSLFLSFVAIYLSATRGAILALFFSLLFFLFFIFKFIDFDFLFDFKRNKKLKWILLLIVLFSSFAVLNFNNFSDPLKRIESISFSDSTVKSRMLSLGVSFNAFLEKPFLGWGPENYNLAFDKYYNPRLHQIEQWFDHAHNIIFDILVSSGVFALLAYFSIFFILFKMLLLHSKKNKKSFIESYLFISLISAYFFQNLFVFDSLSTYLSFFVLLALIPAVVSDFKFKYEFNATKPISFKFVLLLFLFMSFLVYSLNIKPLLASNYAVRALAMPFSDYDKALIYFDKSINNWERGTPEITLRMFEYIKKIEKSGLLSDKELIKLTDKVSEKMDIVEKIEPRNFRYYSYYMDMVSIKKDDKEFLMELEVLFDRVKHYAPNKPITYAIEYKIKYLLGKNEEAIKSLEKAVFLYPDMNFVKVLIFNYNKDGRRDDILKVYDFALKNGRISPEDKLKIAMDMIAMGEKERGVFIIKDVIKNNKKYKKEGINFLKKIDAL